MFQLNWMGSNVAMLESPKQDRPTQFHFLGADNTLIAFYHHAGEMHILAMKFVATYEDAVAGSDRTPARLTRREIQCLKWAAAGKTDAEVSEIVAIALPTVRFHIGNAARKLAVSGRAQAIHRAAILGYIGAGG